MSKPICSGENMTTSCRWEPIGTRSVHELRCLVRRIQETSVLLMFESVLARDESHHAAFGMNVFTAALEAAIRAVRIDRPLLVTLYR
jgi:hypothetical protein